MADAGRAMMLYRGMYDSTYTYEKLDVVNHNGSLYISTTDGNLGTEPTEETKWKLFLQGGVADNIRATDTYGLVGKKGDSSFVQLLLDSLASRVQGVALNRQTLGYSKKNLYDNIGNFVSNSYGGVTISRGENDTFNAIGTATDSLNVVQKTFSLPVGKYIISKKISSSVVIAFYNRTKNKFIIYNVSTTGTEFEITDENDILDIRLQTMPGKVYDITGQAIMIRSAEITDGTYEPYVDDVDTRLQKIDDSILNTLEEIDANTSEGNIAGALALKKAIVKSTYVTAEALPNEELDSDNAIGKFRFVVPISVDYSGINGKILSTSLIHIGIDSTHANGGLSKSLLLAGMGGDGNEKIIKNILVYSKGYQTVRAKILVEYVEN